VTQDRTALVNELIDFSRPIAKVLEDLAVFGWDSDEKLSTLEPANLESVLNRFLSGELSAADVEDWANAIECRDDIGLGQAAADAFHGLANPLFFRPLTRQSAAMLVAALHGSAT
jgi:hypothetical protein